MNSKISSKTLAKPARLLVVLAISLATLPTCFAEEVGATPYRPTISNPAELSAPGWLEVEAGISRAKGGSARWQDNTPWLLKLGITEDFGIMLGGDFQARQIGFDGTRLQGAGDTSLIFKHHWGIDDDTALGLEWGSKFSTAGYGLGSGKQDYGINGIVSQDIGDYRLDVNLGATQLGLAEAGLAHRQYQWAAAVSRPLSEKWSAALETAGIYRHGSAPTTQLLAAASYSISRQLVVDFGVTSQLAKAAPDWSVFIGITYLAGKLW